LREIEARTLTDYAARLIETADQRQYRQTINTAAREHHGRLIADFEKAKDYHATARALASGARGSEPEFTDRERINLEIYGERQNDEATRQYYLQVGQPSDTKEKDISETSRDR